MLPSESVRIREYLDRNGVSPFARWFNGLDGIAAAKVQIAIERMRMGNFSEVKGVGAGVFERRIDFGQGYRIYFGKHGDKLVVLLGGGTNVRQQRDIAVAVDRWQDYKSGK